MYSVAVFIDKLMDVELTRLETFHSHLEGLWRLNPNDLKHQVFHLRCVRWSCDSERIEIYPRFVQLTSINSIPITLC